MELVVHSEAEIDRHLQTIDRATCEVHDWLLAHKGTPAQVLRAMKFDQVGSHPIGGHPLNIIEQINQTFTYAVALSAAKLLLRKHADTGGLILAPGAHMSRAFDIVSDAPDVVAAETFAAVDPRNNRKLTKDLAKMAECQAQHRYVFFASPLFPETARQTTLEKNGVEVWSLALA